MVWRSEIGAKLYAEPLEDDEKGVEKGWPRHKIAKRKENGEIREN